MDLYPAIDLRGGKIVRLQQGSFAAETVYGADPVSVARAFEAAGAPWIHTVDLDGARTGRALNRVLIAAIAEAVNIPVQAGGGVRDRDTAEALLDTGVQRIVVGTAATEEPGLVEWLALKYPGRIAVGLDARGGTVATRGWESDSGASVLDLVRHFSNRGVAAFIVTDIDRDGMLGGADVAGLAEVLAATDVDVIASGGVGAVADLEALMKVRPGGWKKLSGVIVGKALYEGAFTVEEAVAALTDGDDA